MVIDKLSKEAICDLADSIDEDFIRQGHSLQICPICGNTFEKIGTEYSYTIKCRTEGCIKVGIRGL